MLNVFRVFSCKCKYLPNNSKSQVFDVTPPYLRPAHYLMCMNKLAQKMPVFVKETTLQAAVPSTAAELLKSYPNSPYTSLLVTSRGYISSFDQHCTRLSSGLTRLRSARNSAAKDLASDGTPNGPGDRDVGPDCQSAWKGSTG